MIVKKIINAKSATDSRENLKNDTPRSSSAKS
jgi:hypothetical protein